MTFPFSPSFHSRLRLRAALVLLAGAALLLGGCDQGGDDETRVTEGVVVASGTFGSGGEIVRYDPEADVTGDRTDQGGFVQSMTVGAGLLYVVTNGADLINVFDAFSGAQLDQIQDPLRSPRHLALTDDNRAFVTHLRLNDQFEVLPGVVSVIDLTTGATTDSVTVGRSPEGLAIAQGKVFVAQAGETSLAVIDADDLDTRQLDLNCTAPNEVFRDAQGEIVVVCEGDATTNAEVVFVDPGQERVVTRLPLGAPAGSINFTQSAAYAPGAEALFVLSGNAGGTGQVFRIDTATNARDGTVPVPDEPELTDLAAVAYDGVRGELYVARLAVGNDGTSPDFTAQGTVLVLDDQGTELDRFDGGITPTHITPVQRFQ
jgi:hypothetical protein